METEVHIQLKLKQRRVNSQIVMSKFNKTKCLLFTSSNCLKSIIYNKLNYILKVKYLPYRDKYPMTSLDIVYSKNVTH